MPMKKHLLIVSILLIVPSVTFASWWNPSSWGILSFLFHADQQVPISTTTALVQTSDNAAMDTVTSISTTSVISISNRSKTMRWGL